MALKVKFIRFGSFGKVSKPQVEVLKQIGNRNPRNRFVEVEGSPRTAQAVINRGFAKTDSTGCKLKYTPLGRKLWEEHLKYR